MTQVPGKSRRCTRQPTRLAGALTQAGAAWALLGSPAWAAAADEAKSGTEAGEAYVDRLIDGGSLAPEFMREEPPAAARSGNLRSLVVELGGSVTAPRARVNGLAQPGSDPVQRESGLLVSARYQSDNLGLLGLDAQLRRGASPGPFGNAAREHWSGSVTATSRGLPLGDGWLADVAAGATAMPVSDLARRQSRFFLPSLPIMGAQSVLRSYAPLARDAGTIEPEPVATVNLAVGEPGLFGGVRSAISTVLAGWPSRAAARWRWRPAGRLPYRHWRCAIRATLMRSSCRRHLVRTKAGFRLKQPMRRWPIPGRVCEYRQTGSGRTVLAQRLTPLCRQGMRLAAG